RSLASVRLAVDCVRPVTRARARPLSGVSTRSRAVNARASAGERPVLVAIESNTDSIESRSDSIPDPPRDRPAPWGLSPRGPAGPTERRDMPPASVGEDIQHMATSTIDLSAGLDGETLEMVLASLREFARARLGDAVLLDLDARDEMPLDVVREMCGGELGIQLLFV